MKWVTIAVAALLGTACAPRSKPGAPPYDPPPAGVPVPPACPQAPVGGDTATVTGTLTAANLLVPNVANVALPTQGIDPGAAGFAEIVQAIRNGAAYANVHTSKVPSGEIRGALGKAHDHGNGDDDNDD